jgi:hypothetical protein
LGFAIGLSRLHDSGRQEFDPKFSNLIARFNFSFCTFHLSSYLYLGIKFWDSDGKLQGHKASTLAAIVSRPYK